MVFWLVGLLRFILACCAAVFFGSFWVFFSCKIFHQDWTYHFALLWNSAGPSSYCARDFSQGLLRSFWCPWNIPLGLAGFGSHRAGAIKLSLGLTFGLHIQNANWAVSIDFFYSQSWQAAVPFDWVVRPESNWRHVPAISSLSRPKQLDRVSVLCINTPAYQFVIRILGGYIVDRSPANLPKSYD